MDLTRITRLTIAVLVSAAACHPCRAQKINDRELLDRSIGSIAPVIPRPDTVSILFMGDVMLHENQIKNAADRFRRRYPGKDTCRCDAFDFSLYLSELEDRIERADIAVANMEFTLAGEPYTGYPAFSAPDSYARYMAECGTDVFLTANNHILDKGGKGAVRTMQVYDTLNREYGTMSTGTSADPEQEQRDNPLIIEKGGIRIAFVNFTYGTNATVSTPYPKVNRERQVNQLLSAARERGADLTIALPHWGEEYRLRHSQKQEELARQLAMNGADLIIGTHPHVVQDSLSVSGPSGEKVPVLFSLGNLISNMSATDTQIGIIAEARAVKMMNGKTVMLPLRIEYTWCSLPGRLKDSHCTVPVMEYIGRKHLWMMPYEYEKMLDTYYRVRKNTGVKDQN